VEAAPYRVRLHCGKCNRVLDQLTADPVALEEGRWGAALFRKWQRIAWSPDGADGEAFDWIPKAGQDRRETWIGERSGRVVHNLEHVEDMAPNEGFRIVWHYDCQRRCGARHAVRRERVLLAVRDAIRAGRDRIVLGVDV
jgi:hypothetical protein